MCGPLRDELSDENHPARDFRCGPKSRREPQAIEIDSVRIRSRRLERAALAGPDVVFGTLDQAPSSVEHLERQPARLLRAIREAQARSRTTLRPCPKHAGPTRRWHAENGFAVAHPGSVGLAVRPIGRIAEVDQPPGILDG